MSNNRALDFNGAGFCLVAIIAGFAHGWLNIVIIFFDREYFVVKLFVAAAMLRILMHPLDRITEIVHCFLVGRYGMLRGVLMTMLILAVAVRCSLALSSSAHDDPGIQRLRNAVRGESEVVP